MHSIWEALNPFQLTVGILPIPEANTRYPSGLKRLELGAGHHGVQLYRINHLSKLQRQNPDIWQILTHETHTLLLLAFWWRLIHQRFLPPQGHESKAHYTPSGWERDFEKGKGNPSAMVEIAKEYRWRIAPLHWSKLLFDVLFGWIGLAYKWKYKNSQRWPNSDLAGHMQMETCRA